jgi:D-3-phosphoglycerate dehydrogenase
MLILIADNMEEEAVEELRNVGDVEFKPEDLKKSLAEADVLVVRSATKVTKELLDDAKNLKMVARAGIGLDNIDQEACKEKGIKVVNTPGTSTNSVAELVLGLMIASMRNVQKAHHQMKGELWDKKHLTGREIEGKTLGVIGYGRIGHLLGKKASMLGMKVLAEDPHPREDGIASFVTLDELLAQADVISLHTALVESTRDLINKESISKMKDGVVLINTSRGGVIDEDALYEGCKSGKIAGAALDVYKEEPYKGKLLELDNVYFTPHLGASTKEAQVRIGKEIAEKIKEL